MLANAIHARWKGDAYLVRPKGTIIAASSL
jgi:hypothetical protein